MRLFIAIPTTDDFNTRIENQLTDIRKILKGKDIRYRQPDKWHVTLIFLGEQDESAVPKITKGIENIFKTLQPIDIQMKEIKFMPTYREPSMIWMATEEDSSRELGSIKGKIAKELERLGISWKRNKRTYKGHITLARFSPEKENALPSIRQDVDLSYTSPSIQLIKSELKPEGAKYTVLEEFSF